MADSVLSLIFPLHDVKRLVNEEDKNSFEYLECTKKQSFKKSLILFGEENM